MAENVSKDLTKDVPDTEPVRRTNPFQFFREVRREVSKVTWPTWKETYLTTIMVFVMVLLTMVFFFIVDDILGFAVSWLLRVGG